MSSIINIALFGIGNVGGTLIQQISDFNNKTKGTIINLFAVANSKQLLVGNDIGNLSWEDAFKEQAIPYEIDDVFAFAKANSLENLLVVDVTASATFVDNYLLFIQEGFHIVTANKIANTLSYEFYQELRDALVLYNKQFHYETNVGAGLPVIETIKNLHQSGEEIHKIRGVFSGSLSYLFNTFSKEEKAFSEILLEADALGLTEPDAREDLSGKDVARKLLILGRELGVEKEVEDVHIQSLVPSSLHGKTSVKEFQKNIQTLDPIFKINKDKLGEGEVLRHIGELDVKTHHLEVKLIPEPSTTALGQTKGADALFEIYTKSYGEQPIVIQGAGAGKAVTARGVLSDILKVVQSLN